MLLDGEIGVDQKVGPVTKILRGSRNPKTHMGPRVGVAIIGQKINKPKTMIVGALLVATGLLSCRTFFFLKLDKK